MAYMTTTDARATSPGSTATTTGTQGGGAYGSIPGSAYDYTDAYGGKPNVPNPIATAGQAISGNIQNLPDLENLGGQLNQWSTGQLNTALGGMIPNYAALTSARSGDISSELSGQLPQDVQNQIAQQSAERGVATGTIGSPNANAALLAAMGLNSLQMTQTGQQNLAQAVSSTPLPQLFNPQSMMINPSDIQQAQMAANLYTAAPNPAAAAEAARQAAMSGISSDQTGNHGPISLTPAQNQAPWWAQSSSSGASKYLGPEDTGYPNLPVYSTPGDPGAWASQPAGALPPAYEVQGQGVSAAGASSPNSGYSYMGNPASMTPDQLYAMYGDAAMGMLNQDSGNLAGGPDSVAVGDSAYA